MLVERMKKFGLELAEDKSRIMPFGRYKGTKESFDFLGFTHYNGKSHWGKYCVLHRTSKKKLKQKRQSVKEWISCLLSMALQSPLLKKTLHPFESILDLM